jgi:hypothetical protein
VGAAGPQGVPGATGPSGSPGATVSSCQITGLVGDGVTGQVFVPPKDLPNRPQVQSLKRLHRLALVYTHSP